MSDALIWKVEITELDQERGLFDGLYSSPQEAMKCVERKHPGVQIKWQSDDDKGRMCPVYTGSSDDIDIDFIFIIAHVIDPPDDWSAEQEKTFQIWKQLQGVTE